MNAFSKCSRSTSYRDRGSSDIDVIDVQRAVEIEEDGVVTTHVETKRVKLSEYAETLGLPTDDQYQLRDMLKAGFVPEEINVHGMLDNPDPSDTETRDSLLDRLFAASPKSDVKPEPQAVQQAAEVASETVETIKND